MTVMEYNLVRSGEKLFIATAMRSTDGVLFGAEGTSEVAAVARLQVWLKGAPVKAPEQTLEEYLASPQYQDFIVRHPQ